MVGRCWPITPLGHSMIVTANHVSGTWKAQVVLNSCYGTRKSKCHLRFLMRFKLHDDFIKWKHFPRYWPFMRGIHRSLMNSPQKVQWCGALMFSLICACTNGWVNNQDAGDLRCHCAHYDVTVMHWIWVMHRCVSYLAIFGSNNGFKPVWHQAII